MCGIAGIIGRLDGPNRAALKRMNDAMVHRGPDAREPLGVEAEDARALGRAGDDAGDAGHRLARELEERPPHRGVRGGKDEAEAGVGGGIFACSDVGPEFGRKRFSASCNR